MELPVEVKPVKAMTFEEALSELEEISAKMGQGGLPLSETVEVYARGVELSKHCRKLLDAAQRKIQKLDGELSELTGDSLKADTDDARF